MTRSQVPSTLVELTSNTFPLTIQNHGDITYLYLREMLPIAANTLLRIRILDRIEVDTEFVAGSAMRHVNSYYERHGQVLFIENKNDFTIFLEDGTLLGSVR